MTTAIVDIVNSQKAADADTCRSKLNSADGLEDLVNEANITASKYYYSSGTFNFMLEDGFRPETLELKKITTIPFLPNWYLGIVSIHGVIMPVIDILGFAERENINVTKKANDITYLLKLEHQEYNPIVLSLDAIPRLINIENLKTNKKSSAPNWIKHYLETTDLQIAILDHHILFDQLINKQ